MQVDGEAIRLNPANIELNFMNQSCMLSKTKGTIKQKASDQEGAVLKLGVSRIKMADYESYHHNKEKIRELAAPFGEISTSAASDLEQVRALIDKIQENNPEAAAKDKNQWCFVDAVTAGRFFRIDRGQENLHFVLDICDGEGKHKQRFI